MVVIDATMLLLMLRPETPVPADPNGVPIDRPKERVEHLIQQLDKAKTKVIIPTPALSEALVRAGVEGSQQIIDHLQKYSVFRIEPFDTRAAIEVAAMARTALDGGNKKGAATAATYAKVKYDRQIAAIARVCGASTIYSDDGDLKILAEGAKITVVTLSELPLPPEKAQHEMELTGAHEGSVKPPGSDDAQS
jgi:hypothetical protein